MAYADANFDHIYDFENPVQEQSLLFGRDGELATFQQIFKDRLGKLCLVLGGAHAGKTSFLLTLDAMLTRNLEQRQAPLTLPYYTIPKELESSDRFFEELVVGLRGSARDLLGVCSIEERELVYSSTFRTPKEYLARTIPQIRDACANKLGGLLKLVVMIDDADALLDQPWRADLFSAIQSMFAIGSNYRADLVLILAGAQPLFAAANQEAAFRSLAPRQIRLSDLSPEATQAMIQTPLAPAQLAPQFLSSVYGQTGGHPFLTKYLMANLYTPELPLANPAPEQVNQNARDLVRQDETVRQLFNDWGNSCGENGRWIYRLLLEAGGKLGHGEILQRTTGFIQPPIDPVLDMLCCHGLVTRMVDGTETYAIAGDMFAEWFRNNIYPGQQPPQAAVAAHVTNIFAPVLGPLHTGSGDINVEKA